jgi:lysophospholipase L1-like esterase
MRLRRRRLWLPLLKLVLGIAISLAILEIGVRVLAPQKRAGICITTWDRVAGTRNIPGARGVARTPEYEMRMSINSHGLRDREIPYAKPDGVRRILCLGDSYTFGYGVQAAQTYAKLVEDRLRADTEPEVRWEVINAGVGSTGTAHQLAYLTSEGIRYAPDIVTLCFCPANDFWENITSGLFTLAGDSLLQHEAPRTAGRKIQRLTKFIPFYNSLVAHSQLLNLLRYRISALHYRDLARNDPDDEDVPAVLQRRDHLTRRLLARMQEFCRTRGCDFVLVVIPPPADTDLPRRTRELTAFAADRGIPCLDLGPIMAAAEARGAQLIFPHDGHWNAEGHRLVADALHEVLQARLDAPPGQMP